jgi:hypothetical protein
MSVLMILLIIGGVLLLVCAGVCGGCALMASRTVQEVGQAFELLPVQIAAMQAVQENQEIRDKLGEPVAQTSPPVREGSGELKSSETFNFEVSGPNGTAKVKATAEKSAGTWSIKAITAMASDGTSINVPPPAATGPDVQFDMSDMPEMPDEAK